MKSGKTAALVVAAGRGARARRDGSTDSGPKQYQLIGGKAILHVTLEKFLHHPLVDVVITVIHEDDGTLYEKAIDGLTSPKLMPPVFGGSERQHSVLAGLRALENHSIDYVLVHDAVRPFVSPATIGRVHDALQNHPAALPTLPIVETIKKIEEGDANDARVGTTVDRTGLHGAQTPQGFHFDRLLAAHLAHTDAVFTDDCAIMEKAGYEVVSVNGNIENIKITTADDIDRARKTMERTMRWETRVGNGFDVHAFEAGNHVVLCGVEIPHNKKLKGHSDADVGLHTVTDALYGALAEGDIGAHFPPSDPQWKGAASDIFLKHAVSLVKERDGRIVHLDLTIMCEAPKVGPHRDAMQQSLSVITGVPTRAISVKATTTERLGFTGREEGIAAMATATIELPYSGDEDE